MKESIDIDRGFVLVNGDLKLGSTISLTTESLRLDLCSSKEQTPLNITVVAPSNTEWVVVFALSSDQIDCSLNANAEIKAQMTA